MLARIRQTVAPPAGEQLASAVQYRDPTPAVSTAGIDGTYEPSATTPKMACRPDEWHSLFDRLPLGVSVGSRSKHNKIDQAVKMGHGRSLILQMPERLVVLRKCRRVRRVPAESGPDGEPRRASGSRGSVFLRQSELTTGCARQAGGHRQPPLAWCCWPTRFAWLRLPARLVTIRTRPRRCGPKGPRPLRLAKVHTLTVTAAILARACPQVQPRPAERFPPAAHRPELQARN
jgi:hypothetical protein